MLLNSFWKVGTNDVYCIDLDDGRLDSELMENVHFQIMDASKMAFTDSTFDTVVLYNAFSHIQSQWFEIKQECMRVLKTNGVIYVVGTWKIDTHLMMEVFGDEAKWRDGFLIVEIRK